MSTRANESYIGDGVYARFDGYHIWLRTTRWDELSKLEIDNEIALELPVYRALIVYANNNAWPKYSDKGEHDD